MICARRSVESRLTILTIMLERSGICQHVSIKVLHGHLGLLRISRYMLVTGRGFAPSQECCNTSQDYSAYPWPPPLPYLRALAAGAKHSPHDDSSSFTACVTPGVL